MDGDERGDGAGPDRGRVSGVTLAKHPAKFADTVLPVIAEHLAGYWRVLDPMAGVGTLARYLHQRGHGVFSLDIEPEWADQCPAPSFAWDARDLTGFASDGFFDAVATSPTYGNRMADSHVATERCRKCAGLGFIEFPENYVGAICPKCEGAGRRQYKRNTYTHILGRKLTPGNTGAMQWGEEYRRTHEQIIAECVRVIRPGGRVVWVVKDHIRKGEVAEVVRWHREALEAAGLEFAAATPVAARGNRQGQNHDLRLDHEWVLVFDKR